MKHPVKSKRILATCALIAACTTAYHLLSSPSESNSRPPETTRAPIPALNTALVLPPPASVAQEEPIRPEIQSAIDPQTPPARRTELITSLPKDLTEAEWRILIREVLTLPAPGTPEAWHSSHVHEICNILQRIPASHDLFADALATVAAHRGFTDVYRDYAFQHLRTLWRSSLDPLSPGVAQPRNIAIEKTFRKLLADHPETSAKAILGLHEFRHEDGTPAVPDAEIGALARQLLDTTAPAESTHIPSRMTAVRIIAERNLLGSSDLLKSIATSPQEHTLVRTSAIGAIGAIAAPEDKTFLASLSAENPLIAEALQHALKQF